MTFWILFCPGVRESVSRWNLQGIGVSITYAESRYILLECHILYHTPHLYIFQNIMATYTWGYLHVYLCGKKSGHTVRTNTFHLRYFYESSWHYMRCNGRRTGITKQIDYIRFCVQWSGCEIWLYLFLPSMHAPFNQHLINVNSTSQISI